MSHRTTATVWFHLYEVSKGVKFIETEKQNDVYQGRMEGSNGQLFNESCCSVAKSDPTLCSPKNCSTPGFPVFHYHSVKLISIDSVMPANHLILCCHLLLLHSVFLSTRIFSNELALWIRWPKYWTFSFSISPSNEYSWLISFRIDWFDFLAVKRLFKV